MRQLYIESISSVIVSIVATVIRAKFGFEVWGLTLYLPLALEVGSLPSLLSPPLPFLPVLRTFLYK